MTKKQIIRRLILLFTIIGVFITTYSLIGLRLGILDNPEFLPLRCSMLGNGPLNEAGKYRLAGMIIVSILGTTLPLFLFKGQYIPDEPDNPEEYILLKHNEEIIKLTKADMQKLAQKDRRMISPMCNKKLPSIGTKKLPTSNNSRRDIDNFKNQIFLHLERYNDLEVVDKKKTREINYARALMSVLVFLFMSMAIFRLLTVPMV